MSIMEKDLPMAESIESGDYLRMVTSNGNSKKIDKTKAIGYDIQINSTKKTLVAETSVTTTTPNNAPCAMGSIEYSWSTTPETLTVTFNGTEYTFGAVEFPDGIIYGAINESTLNPDFSEDPIRILFVSTDLEHIYVYTENAGTYTIKIEEGTTVETVSTTDDFEKAVNNIINNNNNICFVNIKWDDSTAIATTDKTYIEIEEAIRKGNIVIGNNIDNKNILLIANGYKHSSFTIYFVGLAGDVSYSFVSNSENDFLTTTYTVSMA